MGLDDVIGFFERVDRVVKLSRPVEASPPSAVGCTPGTTTETGTKSGPVLVVSDTSFCRTCAAGQNQRARDWEEGRGSRGYCAGHRAHLVTVRLAGGAPCGEMLTVVVKEAVTALTDEFLGALDCLSSLESFGVPLDLDFATGGEILRCGVADRCFTIVLAREATKVNDLAFVDADTMVGIWNRSVEPLHVQVVARLHGAPPSKSTRRRADGPQLTERLCMIPSA